MNEPTTYLGNKQLHRRHSVMIEGGNVPRARVMDQHIIDRYLMDGLLTLGQHRGGERILQAAGQAGMWATGINWLSSDSGGKSLLNNVPFGLVPFARLLRIVEEQLSRRHGQVVVGVIVHEQDVRGRPQMKMLRDALDYVDVGAGSPLRRLRMKMGGPEASRQVAINGR